MGIGLKLFTSIDHDFINKSFGRNATSDELKLLYNMLEPVLLQRELFQDKYIKQIEYGQRDNHYRLESECVEIEKSGKLKKNIYIYRKFMFKGVKPSQLEFFWMFAPPKSYLKKISRLEESKILEAEWVVNHHIPSDAKKKKSGSLFVCALSDNIVQRRPISYGQTIGYISVPNPGKTLKHEKNIFKILNSEPSYVWGMMVESTLGRSFRRLLNNIPKSLSIKLAVPKTIKKGDGIILSKDKGHLRLKKHFNKLGYDYRVIGKVKQDQYHEIDTGHGSIKKWSLGFQKLSQIDHQTGTDNHRNVEYKNNVKTLSNLSVVKKMLKSDKFIKNSLDDSLDTKGNIVMQISQLNTIDYKRNLLFSGVRSIADIIRMSSAKGINPKYIQINSNISEKRYLLGQNQAIDAFGLAKTSHYHFSNRIEKDLNQIILFGDRISFDKPKHRNGDFISLLGALKGELNDSLYSRVAGKTFDDSKNTYDLIMEHNINQVLIESVSNNVIKTVQTISKGGLAMALCNLYLKLENRFGLKVHVSRKIPDSELLFGESYGSALITIGERELMEFQRICIAYGIPSSTIGRLHETPEVRVNDIIKVNGKVLDSI